MSEQEKNESIEAAASVLSKPGKITIDTAQLQSLMTSLVEAAVSAREDKLANAILESRKPWRDPAQEANEKAMRQSMRDEAIRQRKDREAERENCPHLQGSNPLSEFQGMLSSFIFHTLDTGKLIGICTNCQKIIDSQNPADRQFFAKKSANRPSASGRRQFMNPAEAMRKGTLQDEQKANPTPMPEQETVETK